MGVSSRGRDATIPEGAQIGLGVRTAAIRSVQIQGSLTNTGNVLSVHSLQTRKPVRSRGLFWEQDCQRRSIAFDAMRAPPLQYDYDLTRRLAHNTPQ